MKRLSLFVGILTAVAAPGASAQSTNLTGIYTCIEMCRGGLPAHVTQNGSALNLISEAGVPARAWPGLVLADEPDMDWCLERRRGLFSGWHAHSVRQPMKLRFLLQPTMAAIAGVRDGLKDARSGHAPPIC
jgi:hypothetical protein